MSDDTKLSDRLERLTSTWLISLLSALGGVVGYIAFPRLQSWLLGVTDDQVRLKIAGISTGLALVLMPYVTLLKWRLSRRGKLGRVSAHDLSLIGKFMRLLPSESDSIRTLGSHDFGGAVLGELFDSLYAYRRDWRGADSEFDDAETQAASQEFGACLDRLLDGISLHMAPGSIIGGREYFSLGMTDGEMRQEVLRIRDELNKDAEATFEAHQKLIRRFRAQQRAEAG